MAENVLTWLGVSVLFGVAFTLLFREVGRQNFRKALIGMAHRDASITIAMVIDLYLGANEKSRSSLSVSDMKRLESSFLWVLAKLGKKAILRRECLMK